jgi:hypothetical protein
MLNTRGVIGRRQRRDAEYHVNAASGHDVLPLLLLQDRQHLELRRVEMQRVA